MNYKSCLIISLILFTSSVLRAQTTSETRSFIKSLPVDRETTLEIFNKYGTIQITPSTKDSVLIRAEVKAYAKDNSKLSKMFDGISVDFTNTKYIVRAETEFTSNINTLFESFKGMTSKIISYDSRVEINYYISVPEYVNLKIDNKYGDIYMEDCSGELNISLSNGSLKANSIGKNSKVKLIFCDAQINSIASGNLDASFSELTIGSAGDLTINSISSKYDIKKAGSIRGESRRDKFFIGNVESLQGDAYFTDYRLETSTREIDLITRYGNVDVRQIEKSFELINIKSSYTDISLTFDQGSSYNLDVRHINAFLVLPDKNTQTEEKALNEDRKEYITSGTVGRSPGKSKLKIDATHGNIYIK